MAQIKIERYYDVGCDICAKHLSTDFGTGMYPTADEIRNVAKEIGFKIINNQNMCPECYGKYRKEVQRWQG